VVAALGALFLVLLLAVGLGATGHLGNQSLPEAHTTRTEAAAWDASSSAPSTAERAAATILAYDYRSLPATEKEATQFMTSDYAKQYTQTFEKVVVPAAKEAKAKVTADVQASSVVRATPDKVRVLLYVDQNTVSAANRTPQVALNRVEMVMVRRSGSWLVDAITSY
jgi:Mce-associated membrane protein